MEYSDNCDCLSCKTRRLRMQLNDQELRELYANDFESVREPEPEPDSSFPPKNRAQRRGSFRKKDAYPKGVY